MGRASGRKNFTRQPVPGSPEGREIGVSALQDPAGSPIPGLTGNIVNYETNRQQVPAPEPMDEFRGMMAHGVPHDEHATAERALMERDGTIAQHQPPSPPRLFKRGEQPPAVPVYIVERSGGPQAIRTASPRSITVPANSGADAVRICGKSATRVRIGLLNEDTATNIRFARLIADLNNGGGALLPWPTNSYTWLETQDELYAVTASATLTVKLSIIEEFEQVQ